MYRYPRVLIEYCTKCKWNLRAAWYLQELLSTFGEDLGEVAMAPADSGVFRVLIIRDGESEDEIVLWDRKINGGFPDSKDLKQYVRDVIAPERNLGHVDKHKEVTTKTECKDCN